MFESSSRPWENRSVATKFWRKGRNTSIKTAPRRLYCVGGGGRIQRHPNPPTPKKSFSSDFGHFILNDFRTDFCIEALAQSGAQRQEVVGRVNCQPPPHTDTKGNAALLRKGLIKINHGSWFDTYPIATYLPTYGLHVSRTAKNGGDRQVRSKLRGAKRNHSKLIHWEIKQIKQNIHTYFISETGHRRTFLPIKKSSNYLPTYNNCLNL